MFDSKPCLSNMDQVRACGKTEMKEHGMDKDAKEHGHWTVVDLTMVSDTCPK